jgi:PAS domain S-box-containing protein
MHPTPFSTPTAKAYPALERRLRAHLRIHTAEATNRTLDIIIPENLRERHWRGHAETMRTGRTKYGRGDLLAVPALRKDGARISIEFSIIPFRDANGAMCGMAAIMRDVTKRFEEVKVLRKQLADGGAPGS